MAVFVSGLIGLSVRIRLTLGTRVRIEIMKLLAERYRTSNPGSKTQVVNYESRPTMKFTPAPSASDRRVMHFNYIRAVTKLPVNFTTEELAPVYKLAMSSSDLTGKLRATFIILSDDVAREISRSQNRAPPSSSASADSGPANPSANPDASRSTTSAPFVPASGSRGAGRGGGGGGRSSRTSRSSSHMEHDRSRSRSPLRGQHDS